MPYDSNGNFTRVHNWEEDRQNDIDIVSDRHDEEDDNFADGLSDCFLRDGRATMTGDLKMGSYQIKNLAAGSALTDAINKQQLETATSTLNSSLTQSLTEAFKRAINSAVKTRLMSSKSKSLSLTINKYNIPLSIRVGYDNFSLKKNIKYIPYYAVFCITEVM